MAKQAAAGGEEKISGSEKVSSFLYSAT